MPETIAEAIIINPPIVGVPTFVIRWEAGPSLLIGCPFFCKDFSQLIVLPPKIRQSKKEVKMAQILLNVR
jgi:hypothetical protein